MKPKTYTPYERHGEWYYYECDYFECGPFPTQEDTEYEIEQSLYWKACDTVDRSVYV